MPNQIRFQIKLLKQQTIVTKNEKKIENDLMINLKIDKIVKIVK